MTGFNRFLKGSGCFKCERCGKLTRDTHGCGTRLCGKCNDYLENYNSHIDNHRERPDVDCPFCEAEAGGMEEL